MTTNCILNKNKTCDNCGECLKCEFDSNKICDNCMKCLNFDKSFATIKIEEIIKE